MLEQYPKDVKLAYKQFPLGNHKFARPAALASMAAQEQGKFWQLHDLIFANYNKLSDEKIRGLAEQAGLDMKQFDQDLEKNKLRYARQIQDDMREGQGNGVRGTPSIFINGKLLKQRSLQGFKAMIDKELGKK